MFKLAKITLAAVALMASLSVSAQTYWLNIGSYTDNDGSEQPAFSMPTSSQAACSQAVIEYAKTNLVNFIGCDVEPLPHAVNINAYEKQLNVDEAMYDEAYSFSWVSGLNEQNAKYF